MQPHLIALFHLLLVTSIAFGQAPAGHDHGVEIPGLKKDLIAGITADDLLKLGNQPKTVKVVLAATFTSANAGMNFNGYSHGNAVLTVPVGWTVQVTFINPSPIPHSAIVVDKADVKKLQIAEPYFDGGATAKHLQGLTMGKADFSFVADEAGEFALACGFPAHAMAGHWVALNVSADAKTPTLKFGELPEKEVK
jgi:plastocyanin